MNNRVNGKVLCNNIRSKIPNGIYPRFINQDQDKRLPWMIGPVHYKICRPRDQENFQSIAQDPNSGGNNLQLNINT